jgi:apoptosis-inducing factor 2
LTSPPHSIPPPPPQPRDRFFISFASLRATVSPGFEKQTLVPYDRVFKASSLGSMLRGKVVGVNAAGKTVSYLPVDANGVEAAEAKSLPYDFLVIATGSTSSEPLKLSGHSVGEAKASFASTQKVVAEAGSEWGNGFLVVGGGATGCELAGELKSAYPKANVTLVNSGPTLLSAAVNGPALPPKFTAAVKAKLESLGVKVVLGAKVAKPDVEASGGALSAIGTGIVVGKHDYAVGGGSTTTVTAGVSVWATGPKPNTDFLRGGDLASRLDAGGYIKVDLTYAVSSLPLSSGVFSIGDVCASPDAKAGWVVDAQAAIAATNIARLAKAGIKAAANGTSADAAYQSVGLKKGKAAGMGGIALLPLGPSKGIGLLPFGIVGDGFTSSIKGKKLFTDMAAGKIGYKVDEVIRANA